MKKQAFAILSIATLFANKSYGQFATPPTYNSATQVTGGAVGIGTVTPQELLQLGDRFVFHDGGYKYLGYNTHYNGTQNVRLVNDFSSLIGFGNGHINFETAPTGTPGSNITSATAMIIRNTGEVGIGTAIPAAKLDVFGTTNQLRLSYSGTVYSDIQTSSTGNMIFTPNTGKVGFGITPASGVGFHSNMGIFRIADPASTARILQISPNYPGNNEIPAGTAMMGAMTTSGEGLSLIGTGSGSAGVKVGAYAYSPNAGGWRSMWEAANTTSFNGPYLTLVKNNGTVGVGTGATEPRAKLDVIGNIRAGADGAGDATLDPNTALTVYQSGTGKKGLKFKTWDNSLKVISIENSNFAVSPFTVYGDGKVRIGLQNPLAPHDNALLGVSGKIACQSLYVLKATSWADFVFKRNELESLESVEKFVTENKHLPGIPSEEEIYANGYDINEMDAKLLEKIETLYLHIIALEKEIKTLKSK